MEFCVKRKKAFLILRGAACLLLVPILNQMTPLHTTSSYFPKIYFNIILRPKSRTS
jgi:hypothetical protein